MVHQLLTLVFTAITQAQIHQQSRCILHRVVAQVILTAFQDLDDPSYHAALNHCRLSGFAKAELLQRSKSILSKIRVFPALVVESLNEQGYDVFVTQQVRSALVLIGKTVQECDHILLDLDRL